MSKESPLTTRRWGALLWTIALTGLIILALTLGGAFQSADQALYDNLLRYRIRYNPEPLNSRIIQVDLKDTCEKALGGDIASRKAFADLLETLGNFGARATMDLIFKAPAAYDEAFAEAASLMETLVLSGTPIPEGYPNFAHESETLSEAERAILSRNLWHIKEHGRGTIPVARSFIMSNEVISGSARILGHIGVETDRDGNYRRAPLLYRWEDGVIPALSLAMAVDDWGVNPEDIEFYPGKELILPIEGDTPIRIPVDKGGYVIIPYTAAWAEDTYRISMEETVKAKTDPEIFERLSFELPGSIALIADITTAGRDFGVTPFEPVYPLSRIHATVLSGVLNETFYALPPLPLKIILTAAVIILMILLNLPQGLRRKDLLYHFGFLGLFAAYSAVTALLWRYNNMLPWYGTLATTIFFFWLIGFIFRLFYRYKEQLLLHNALTRYFPHSLAERIASEGKTELLPSYKELTILFTDISGFTKWSSNKEPEAVHAFLTEYLESMARIIFEYGGTVDKFMGDGILAFFGDPYDMPDHTERCVKSAIAMQAKIAELAELWKPRVAIDLKVRMGVNTGQVIVGNLGTQTRIEYTVIGSAVNVAQRMEGAAPPGGILVTQSSWEKIQERFQFKEKRSVTVKGYDEPLDGYEVDWKMTTVELQSAQASKDG